MHSFIPQRRVVHYRRPRGTGRRIFIGDIQGCLTELERLLREVEFKPGHDVLYPVGDLVNRGPASKEVLRLLRELDAKPVLGNHDLHLLAVARGKRRMSADDTLRDVLRAPDANLLLEWLSSQPLLRIHPDIYQVHAGFHPQWKSTSALKTAIKPIRGAAAKEANAMLTRVRFCDVDGTMPSNRIMTDVDGNPTKTKRWKPWYSFYQPGTKTTGHQRRQVVYGHWAVMGIVEREFTLGLDSGCVWGGDLSAYIPEDNLLIHVPAKRPYAGNFRPRK